MNIVRFDPFAARGLAVRGALRGVAYDIAREGDDRFAVTLAVPGYDEAQIEITAQDRVLSVKGKPAEGNAPAPAEGNAPAEDGYLHRGIRTGAFEQRFVLAPHVEVAGAELKQGLLRVALERRVPEALRPRTIAIGAVGEAEAA